MASQDYEEESMDFSVIDKKQERQVLFDFSAQSILQNRPELQPSFHESPIIESNKSPKEPKNSSNPLFFNNNIELLSKGQTVSSGNYFLKDLQRMQKQLSFESQSYCIYEEKPYNSLEAALSSKSKTVSCLKVTKEFTNKSISKVVYPNYNYYEGELIFDFNKKNHYPKCKKIKADPKNISRNLLSETSNLSKTKAGKDSIMSKDLKYFLSPGENNHKSKAKILGLPPKSKSKSVSKIGLNNSKSHKNIQISTQSETYPLKILSEYYGSDMSLHCKKVQPNKKKQLLGGLKPREKSSKSKCKLTVISPRCKGMVPRSEKHIK